MPKVSQSYLDARRAEILDAATRCFAREGFHRATMKDIVKESKLSPGAIYNYFRSKEEIIEAIGNERHAKERRMIAEARRAGALEDVLGRVRDEFLGTIKNPKERMHRRVSIQLWAEAQRNPAILKLIQRGVDGPRKLLGSILAEAQRNGEVSESVDADAVARMLVAAFHGLVLQEEWTGEIRVEPQLALLEKFLTALKP
jgi:AcrR family transcriptional regulator